MARLLVCYCILTIIDTVIFAQDSTTLPTTHTTTTRAPCYLDCSDLNDGNYPDPTSNCTGHYYVCANGECFNFYCPPNLVYLADLQDCVYTFQDPGCGTVTSTSTGTTGTRPTEAPCTFDCSNKNDGDYQDPASNCTAHYYVCANGECFNYYCHTPLVYDPTDDSCVYTKDWPGCQQPLKRMKFL